MLDCSISEMNTEINAVESAEFMRTSYGHHLHELDNGNIYSTTCILTRFSNKQILGINSEWIDFLCRNLMNKSASTLNTMMLRKSISRELKSSKSLFSYDLKALEWLLNHICFYIFMDITTASGDEILQSQTVWLVCVHMKKIYSIIFKKYLLYLYRLQKLLIDYTVIIVSNNH